MSDQLPPSPGAMSGRLRVLLFGDQTYDTRAHLRNQLIVGRTNPVLSIFLDRAALALRQEISELSPIERRRIPTFTTLYELADRALPHDGVHTGVESALLCISQFVDYFE